jgi:hypothetical protein
MPGGLHVAGDVVERPRGTSSVVSGDVPDSVPGGDLLGNEPGDVRSRGDVQGVTSSAVSASTAATRSMGLELWVSTA